MKKSMAGAAVIFSVLMLVLCISTTAFSKIEWEVLNNISLKCEPQDIAVSGDGATAYILCKDSIKLFSMRDNKVSDSIPVKDDFSGIALSPDGKKLLLTNPGKKQVSVIQISQVYDIAIGKSPVIGDKNAPVTVFAFLDYQ